jgi:hypothetical protein
MIFTLTTDERSLLVFPTPEEAIAYCEGIDVEAGVWLFWNEDGLPLQPDFLTPNQHDRFSVSSGVYRLLPKQSGNSLAEMLGGIHYMDPNPFFLSLAAVKVHLAGSASATRPGA